MRYIFGKMLVYLEKKQAFILACFFIFGLFVGFLHIRKSFLNDLSFYFGQYSDFLTFSIYLSDLVFALIIFILFSLYIKENKINMAYIKEKLKFSSVPQETKILLFFLIYLLFVLIFSWFTEKTSFWLAFSLVLVPILSIKLYFYKKISQVFSNYANLFLISLLILGILEVFLAVLQFKVQGSLGLPFHMEPVISAGMPGVATILTESGLIMRAYGTFLHPNVLAGFLSILNFLAIYLALSGRKSLKWLGFFGYFCLILGICLTFSRTALVALTFAFLFLLGTGVFWLKNKMIWQISGLGLFALAVFNLVLWPVNNSRLPDLKEPAITERADYNRMATKIFLDSPVFGVGVGKSLLHMEQYAGRQLKAWEHQPAHNFWILLASESGLLGILAYLSVISLLIKKIIRQVWQEKNLKAVLFLSAWVCIFFLMLGDHYLYTLRAGQMVLWGLWLLGMVFVTYNKEQKSAG